MISKSLVHLCLTLGYQCVICSGFAFQTIPGGVRMVMNVGTLISLSLDELCIKRAERD